MLLTYEKVLASKKFRDMEVLAGTYGLEKSIEYLEKERPILSLEDKSNIWLVKEIKKKEELSEDIIKSFVKLGCSGLGIKIKGNKNIIEDRVIQFCEKIDFPLIKVPNNRSLVNILKDLESICLDNKIKKLYTIINNEKVNNHDDKISNVLLSLSEEINKEVKIYDLLSKKIYTSKGRIIKNVELSEYEYVWNPTTDYQKINLSEDLNIFLILDEFQEEKLILPIELEEEILGYLVVKGKNILISEMLILSVKVTYMLLIYEYKIMYSEISKENKEKDRIIKDIISGKLDIEESFFIKEFGKHKMRPYTTISLRQLRSDLNMFMRREKIEKCLYKHINKSDVFLGILDFNELVLLIAEDRVNKSVAIKDLMNRVIKELKLEMKEAKFLAGFNEEYSGIEKLKDIYSKGLKCLDIGEIILKEESIYSYDHIGPFIFFDINELKENKEKLFKEYIGRLLEEDDGKELVVTLKSYLNCNLSVSSTAKKMFLHNNTIRYRISKIEDLLSVDLKDYFSRLKLEVALMFIDIIKS